MRLKTARISDLKPHPKNPNQHPQEQLQELQRSLEQFNQVKNIVVWQNQVIAGCGLLKAAEKQGREEIEIRDVSDWPEEKAIKFMIADNRLAEIAIMDDEMLANLLRGLDDPLEVPGIDDEFLESLDIDCANPDTEEDNSDYDKIPDIDDTKTITRINDLWFLGDHRLLCADCTKINNVNKLLDGEKIKQLLTDPPYGVDYSSKNEFLNKFDEGNRIQVPIENDKICDYVAFFSDFIKNISFAEYNTIYIFMSGLELHNLREAINVSGCVCGDYLVWVKNNHVLGRKDYSSKHEFILYGWKGKHKFYGGFQTTIIEFNRPIRSDLHPTMKPVGLLEKLIRDGSQQKDIVYDPFLGSGSSLIACVKSDRILYGMEIDCHYCDVICQRWSNLTGEDPVRESDGITFNKTTK